MYVRSRGRCAWQLVTFRNSSFPFQIACRKVVMAAESEDDYSSDEFSSDEEVSCITSMLVACVYIGHFC